MKNNKLGAILTAANTPEEVAACVEFTKSASSVFVITHLPVPNTFGLFQIRPRKDVPSLWEALSGHLGRIRGKETIGLVLPGTVLPTDFSALQKALGSNRLELSWAFRAVLSGAPSLIIITTLLLPHIIHNLTEKDSPRFAGTEWSDWLNSWCFRTMPPHRYLEVTEGLGFVAIQPKPIGKAPNLPAEALQEPVQVQVSPTEQKAVKAKKTRSAKK